MCKQVFSNGQNWGSGHLRQKAPREMLTKSLWQSQAPQQTVHRREVERPYGLVHHLQHDRPQRV